LGRGRRITQLGAIGVVAAAATAVAVPSRVSAAGPSITIRAATTAMVNTPVSQTPVSVGCSGGATLLGGGFRDYVAADGTSNVSIPTNGLTMHGTYPSDGSANAAASGSSNPADWTAMGGYAAVSEAGDNVTAFAICGTGGPAQTEVVTATVNGPQVAATTASATATCPGGTSLIGGGGLTNNGTTQPSFKVIGSFPSSSSGQPAANGSSNPTSWTAVGASGGVGSTSNTTTAFAMCSTDTTVQLTVARTDFLDHPETPTTFVTATATCPAGTSLIGGGENADGDATGADGGTPQQGVHVRGTYPSNTDGTAVTDGATGVNSWTTIVQCGGQSTPGTDTHVWALCLGTASPGASGGGSTSSSGSGGSGPNSGGSNTSASSQAGTAGITASDSSTSTGSGAAGTRTPGASLTPALATTKKTVTAKPGHAGSATVSSSSQGVEVSWTKSGLAGVPLKLTLGFTSFAVAGSKGVSATSGAIAVSVSGPGGARVTNFASPLDLAFPGAAANVDPAFSQDGTTWVSIPKLGSATLPPGLTDGYYRDHAGSVHILTLRVAADFGLLIPNTGVKVTKEPLAFGYVVGRTISPAAPRLEASVASTAAGKLTVTLSSGGKKLAVWHLTQPSAPRTLTLKLPTAARAAGPYRLELSLTAGGKHVSHGVPLRVLAPVT
jgi:hypothetical protein